MPSFFTTPEIPSKPYICNRWVSGSCSEPSPEDRRYDPYRPQNEI